MIAPNVLHSGNWCSVPLTRSGEELDEFVYVAPEGHYKHFLNFNLEALSGCFYPWRDGTWLDPVELPLYTMPHFSQRKHLFSSLPYQAEKQREEFNAYQRFWPEFYEDRLFVGGIGNAGVRRVRNGKPYLVYLDAVQEPCPSCPFHHPHVVVVRIADTRSHRDVYRRVFECAECRQGLKHYGEVLDSIDPYLMEDLL